MKIKINRIKVAARIRKEVTKIDYLALDIIEHGLLNPITVMEIADGEYQLLAGLRRLRAMEELGNNEIDVNVVSPANAEAVLRIEISENEQREPFTFSEKMDFARMLEEIEREKARERKSLGGKGGLEQDTTHGADVQRGETREIVAKKIDMGKTSYDRAKYIAENASDEVIAELDRGERSIRGTYDELRAKENLPSSRDIPCDLAVESEDVQNSRNDELATEVSVMVDNMLDITRQLSPKKERQKLCPEDYMTEQDKEAVRKLQEFNAMTPEEKVEELKRQLKEHRARAARAESELTRLNEFHNNLVYHKDGIIKNLSARLENAEDEVTALRTQIIKCEKCKREKTESAV